MSVLETPRIIFGGKMSWDPIVTNNYEQFYDEGSAWTSLSRGESVDAFREMVIQKEAVYQKSHFVDPDKHELGGGLGNWNPDGTHRSVMYETFVSGVDLGEGVVKDPFVGGPVNFKGMLVDSEPYGSFSSQLFFDEFSLGIDGGCRIFAPRSHRMTARYINFFRLPKDVYGFAASVASVNWQTTFSKEDGLKIDAHDSPALQKLSKALEDDDVLGITVRFNAYSTHYYGAASSDEINERETEFVKKLAGGGFQPNPARSYITGVVGLWRKGEPIHEPGDRALLATKVEPPEYVATAHARVNDDCISLDFSNAISETNLELKKQDLGTLTLNAVDAAGSSIKLAEIPYSLYDKKAYETNSGIITLALTGEQCELAQNGLLSLSDQDGNLLLAEQALRVIPNDPNFYIDEGEKTATNVLVLDKGKPVGSGVTVGMVNSNLPSVDQKVVQAKTDDNGVASFAVTGQGGQVEGYVFMSNPCDEKPEGISTQVTTYMYIRTLPNNAADFKGYKPTWENVYNKCLANWNAMAPCMDNWLDLKDPVQVKSYAKVLKRLTAKENFESFLYMPVTRDMTEAERQFLYAYLDSDDDCDGLKNGSNNDDNEDKLDHNKLNKSLRQA